MSVVVKGRLRCIICVSRWQHRVHLWIVCVLLLLCRISWGLVGIKTKVFPSNPRRLLVVILIVLTALYKVILIAISNNQQPLSDERLLVI